LINIISAYLYQLLSEFYRGNLIKPKNVSAGKACRNVF